MARSVTITCDVCKRSTTKIVAKLHYIPMIPGVSRGVHSNYSHQLDVGECCGSRLLKMFNFRKRMTAEEYKQARRAS